MAKDLTKRLAKLLEFRRHPANVFFRCVTDQQEILRPYLHPLVPGTSIGGRKDQDRKGKRDQAEFTGGIHDLVECRAILV